MKLSKAMTELLMQLREGEQWMMILNRTADGLVARSLAEWVVAEDGKMFVGGTGKLAITNVGAARAQKIGLARGETLARYRRRARAAEGGGDGG